MRILDRPSTEPELQIIGIYKTLQYKIDSNLLHLQDFVGAP